MPLWQKEFFDHLLRSVESYEDKCMYVKQNPVRARSFRRRSFGRIKVN
jgi:hypothetical protein